MSEPRDRDQDRGSGDPDHRHGHGRRDGDDPATVRACTPDDQQRRRHDPQPQRREQEVVPVVRAGARGLRSAQELDPVEPGARGNHERDGRDRRRRAESPGQRTPLAADDEPQQRDAGRELGQQAERPQRRVLEPQDAHRRQQDVDVAVEELERNRQEDQPDEGHPARKPDQVDDQEAVPQHEEEAEREQVRRAEHEGEGGRVGEGADRPEGRRIWMKRVDVPVGEGVETDDAVEVRPARNDEHQPREQEVAEDREPENRGLPVERQARADPGCRRREARRRGDSRRGRHGRGGHGETAADAPAGGTAGDPVSTARSAPGRPAGRNRHRPTSGARRLQAMTGHVTAAAA